MVFGITVYFSWLLKLCNKERKVLVFCNDQLRSNHFLSFFFAFKFRGELVVFAQSYLKTVSVSKCWSFVSSFLLLALVSRQNSFCYSLM